MSFPSVDLHKPLSSLFAAAANETAVCPKGRPHGTLLLRKQAKNTQDSNTKNKRFCLKLGILCLMYFTAPLEAPKHT